MISAAGFDRADKLNRDVGNCEQASDRDRNNLSVLVFCDLFPFKKRKAFIPYSHISLRYSRLHHRPQ